jgi:hypothetical protein
VEGLLDFNLNIGLDKFSTVTMTMYVSKIDLEDLPEEVEVRKITKFDVLDLDKK